MQTMNNKSKTSVKKNKVINSKKRKEINYSYIMTRNKIKQKKDEEQNENMKKIKEDNKINCIICLENISEENCFCLKICKHVYCKNCHINYIKEKIYESMITSTRINCPMNKCTFKYEREDILILLNEFSDIKKYYQRMIVRETNKENSNWINCPIGNCMGGTLTRKENLCKCDECGYEFCFKCNKSKHKCDCSCEKCGLISHSGPCECNICGKKENCICNKKMFILNNIIIAKKCPSCKILTQKISGCDHIICADCDYEWCYRCLGSYYKGHMLDFHNPFNITINEQPNSIQIRNEPISPPLILNINENNLQINNLELSLINGNTNEIIPKSLEKISISEEINKVINNRIICDNIKFSNITFNKNIKYKIRIRYDQNELHTSLFNIIN